MRKRKKRLLHLTLFLLLLATEVGIAVCIHDSFVRPYVGDVLVVAVLYFFLRIFIPEKYPWLPAAIFAFASAVEVSQYFHLAAFLGLENGSLLSILFGSVYDIGDIVCYGIGSGLLGVYELLCCRVRANHPAL